MSIKSLFVVAVIATAILCSGGIVNATDNSALIAQLQAQIASLLAQIQAIQAQQGTTPTVWCYTFNTNLGYANSGSSAVSQLHTALQKEGISYSPDTGNIYGLGTKNAVREFQIKYGIFSTTSYYAGYVEELTRAKLNTLYSCQPASSILTCTDSDGGRFPNIAGLTDGRVNGIGKYFSDGCVNDNGGQCLGDACTSVHEGYCTASGEVTNILTACSTGYCQNGACTIKNTTQPAITVTSPNGGETFRINSPITVNWTGNKNTTIASVSVLLVNQTSGQKGYSSEPIVGRIGSNQLIIPANAVSSVGQYKVQVCDRSASTTTNPDPICDSSDNYFSIVSVTTPPVTNNYSITVTSPNGGETFNFQKNSVNGTTAVSIPITWNSSGLPTNTGCVKIQILQNSGVAYDVTGVGTGIVCIPNMGQYPLIIDARNNITLGSNFKVRVYYPGDQYHPANWGDDISDSYFTIAAQTTTSPTVCVPNWNCGSWGICTNGQQTKTCTDGNNCGVTTGRPSLTQTCTVSTTPNYSITVTSPNGGETYNIQKYNATGRFNVSIPIRWTSTGLNTNTGCVQVRLLQGGSVAYDTGAAGTGIICIPNMGNYTLIVDTGYYNIIPGSNFKVEIYSPGDRYHPANWADDTSDSYFNITAPTTGMNISQSSLASISDALAKIAAQIQAMLKK